MSSQPLEALAYGNEIRLSRYGTRRRVHAEPASDLGRLKLADELYGRPHHMNGVRLDEALAWVRRWPLDKRTLVLRHVGCSIFREIGDLTSRQHEALLHALRSPAATASVSRSAREQEEA